MNKNYIFIALALIAVIVVGGVFIINNSKTNTKLDTNNSPSNNAPDNQAQGEVKEFKMDSFYEMVDGKPKQQFSLEEITVNKGDTVRIIVTVTKGTHDFLIDEYGINAQTPLDQPTTIEFVADKAGEFVYYCSFPNHRQNGQWGTLTVTE